MGLIQSVLGGKERTVVLVNPNPKTNQKVEPDFDEEVFVQPEAMKFEIINEVPCNDDSDAGQAHQQETTDSEEQEREAENTPDIFESTVLPISTFREMCAVAEPQMTKSDDQQNACGIFQNNSLQPIHNVDNQQQQEERLQTAAPANEQLTGDDASALSIENRDEQDGDDLEKFLYDASLEVEKAHFETITRNLESIIGKTMDWQEQFAIGLANFKKEVLKCYNDNVGEVLTCADLSENYGACVNDKRLEFLAKRNDVKNNLQAEGVGDNAEQAANESSC